MSRQDTALSVSQMNLERVVMFRDKDGWIAVYTTEKQALWIHSGNPQDPHALLASGNHSNGFFNSRLVIVDEKLLDEAAADLIELLEGERDFGFAHCIVGPQTGATKLAELIADRTQCFWASPAKHEEGGEKSMVFDADDRDIVQGMSVLLCEDVLTTGGSVDLTAAAVIAAGGYVLPYVLVLVNRSGLTEVNGRKIIALIDHDMPIWTPDDCPLCQAGSEAVRPKDNWDKLTATYD